MCLYFLHASSCCSVPTQGTHGRALWEYSQKDSASGWGRESHGFFCALGFWGTITNMPMHFCYVTVRPKVCMDKWEVLHLVVGKFVLNSNEIPHYAKWASQPIPFIGPFCSHILLPSLCQIHVSDPTGWLSFPIPTWRLQGSSQLSRSQASTEYPICSSNSTSFQPNPHCFFPSPLLVPPFTQSFKCETWKSSYTFPSSSLPHPHPHPHHIHTHS